MVSPNTISTNRPDTTPSTAFTNGNSRTTENGDRLAHEFIGKHTLTDVDLSLLDEDGMMPIAVVGIACRFPGEASTPEKLWEMCANGRDAWGPIPKSRFNAEAFYHPDADKPGTMNVQHAHFIEEDPAVFDASFFSITPNEAKAMDPAQRKLLESVYESLENGGLPMEKVVGSKTSVFVGAFSKDYGELLLRDPETGPLYQATGTSMATLSNRISYFFDFKGPSVTLDTACSSGLVAVHLACETLRNGEATQAVVAGCNLILSPDNMITMTNLHFLSPDGRSYTYDQRANGYARGEGIASVVLKPLKEALKAGDPIRAIIRGSGVGQDGNTPGMTVPSSDAQESLIRSTYRKAKLPLNETRYFETHGTGTQVGDPLEASAIGRVFGPERSAIDPVYAGSIKTNIGHLENASGIAGFIKAVMVLEKAVILPNLRFENPNSRLKLDEWNIRVPTKTISWPRSGIRRASVNSFGFGGTNAHAIVDDAYHYLTSRGISGNHRTLPEPPVQPLSALSIQVPRSPRLHSSYSSRLRLFPLSANDELAAKQSQERLLDYLRNQSIPRECEEQFLDDLAYTLSTRRSVFPWKVALPAGSLDDLIATAKAGVKPARSLPAPKIGYVFTGQGAQWYAMGRELVEAYPVYKASLVACQKALKGISQWSLMEELLASRSDSKINQPSISQPLCTAVQIALVDLLRSWGVQPSFVVGHSSGEIGAAYTIGALNLKTAMLVSFYRGKLSESIPVRDPKMKGSMLAAGLGEEEAQALVAPFDGKVTVACINSPSSVTLSGDESAIDLIKVTLDQQGKFNRKLVVQAAYHSHQMNVIAKDYLASMSNMQPGEPQKHISMVSSVTRRFIGAEELCTAKYWVRNMLSPVQFSDALRNSLVTSTKASGADILLEIGPHSALAGPIKDIVKNANLTSVQYGASLTRNQDAARTMLGLARQLFTIGYPLDLHVLNGLDCDAVSTPRMLTNLPSYAWNHTTKHWHDSRMIKDYLHRKHPNHPLLGTLTADHNPMEPKWRNFISLKTQPWVEDHQVASSIVYPGAGFVIMAIEALSQILPSGVTGFRLRDVTIGKALVIPEDKKVETMLVLRQYNESARKSSIVWDEFKVFSYTDDPTAPVQEHCRGLIASEKDVPYNVVDNGLEDSERARNEDFEFEMLVKSFEPCDEVKADVFYDNLIKAGLEYGPTFRNIKKLIASEPGCAYAEIEIPNTKEVMPQQYELPHTIHPATLDSCIQVLLAALSSDGSGIKEPMVPTVIENLYISKGITKAPGSRIRARTTIEMKGFKDLDANIIATSLENGVPLIEISGLRCTALRGRASIGLDDGAVSAPIRKLCYNTTWKADPNFLNFSQIENLCRIDATPVFTREMITDYEKVSLHFIRKAVNVISPKADLFPYHRTFLEWMTKVVNTDTNKMPLLHSTSDVHADDALIQMVSKSSSEGRMLVRMGQNLPRVLNKEIDPLSLMLEDNLLYDYYREAIGTDRSYMQMQSYIDLLAHKNPNMTILEIGSGTGGASLPILQTLGGNGDQNARFASYDFTDISSGFFEKAQKNFAAWGSLMKFKKLDIETDPVPQGFKEGGYDLIIAANVLHATKTIRNTMSNVKKLLKPGGVLVMMELTELLLRGHIVFGNLPGWWLGEHEGRKWGPILSIDGWDSALKDVGFTGVEGHVQEFEGEEHMCSVIISTVPLPPKTEKIDTIIVKPEGSYRQPVVDNLEKELKSKKRNVKVLASDELSTIDFTGKTCIFMAEGAGFGLLYRIKDAEFKGIQKCISTCKTLVWVTQGAAIDSPNPHLNLINGLARSIRTENSTFDFITLDLDAINPLPSDKAAKTILSVVDHACSEPTILDTEFAERNGILKVSRVTEAKDYNVAIAARCGKLPHHTEMKTFRSMNRPIRLEIGTPGLLDTLRFSELSTNRNEMGSDEVEIKIFASGLNFRDVMVAMGELTYDFLGCEGSGIITKIGSGVKNVKVGSRVCTWMLGAFNSHIRNPASLVQTIPDQMDFEIAATLPVVYCTAYYGLFDIARLLKNETILIHAAAGGVGQAAIMLAKWIGAEIFVTVGTLEKKKHLMDTYGIPEDHIFSSRDTTFADGIMRMTEGKGVDVVLNSLAGEQLRKSWQCISYFGRFIEMGKKDIDINSRLDMAPFIRNVTFASIDLSTVFAHNKPLGARLLKDVMDLVRKNIIKPVAPITIFPFCKVEEAFRFMQAGRHIGKVVLKPTEDPVPVRPPQDTNSELDPMATYMIVGGLGGLGKSIAQWMVKHGARNLVFLSRSGSKDGHKLFLAGLAEKGCHSVVLACDIGNPTRLKVCIERLKRELPPIRGVIQAAMVLKDSIFEKMPVEDFHEALRPKVTGSWNLHNMLPETLEFFIMLSSSAGIGGNPSQSNYAAANSFQDALANYRNSRGLAATTLDLGMIKGAGYVAENQEAEAKLIKWGYVDITQDEFLAMLDYAIQNPRAGIDRAQITTGLSIKHLLDTKSEELPAWASDPKFSHMIRTETSTDTSTKEGQTASASLSEKLESAATLGDAIDIVTDTILEKLSKVLVIPIEDMDSSKPTHAYGVDSLVAVELRNWLNRDAKADVPVFEIMGSKSLAELAIKTAERSRLLRFAEPTVEA